MPLPNQRMALVNRSSTKIPVYDGVKSGVEYPGGQTVGGSVIGHIWPNEFYSIRPNTSDYITMFKVIFRNGSGAKTYGYIESGKGTFAGEQPWTQYQESFHKYNSNGSTLIKATNTIVKNGSTNYVFTVKKRVNYLNPTGTSLGHLTAGMKIATDCSTMGQSNDGYMLFRYVMNSTGLFVPLTDSYGFVELGFNQGATPSDRAIW